MRIAHEHTHTLTYVHNHWADKFGKHTVLGFSRYLHAIFHSFSCHFVENLNFWNRTENKRNNKTKQEKRRTNENKTLAE